jgi:hypothetical protein
MMFYDTAGGRRYTGLWNAYQGFVDLSTLLKTDRAILATLGPSGPPGAALLRDGRPLAAAQTTHITIYRFVFPVKRGGERREERGEGRRPTTEEVIAASSPPHPSSFILHPLSLAPRPSP